jgi:hypothetical protein
MEEDSDLEEGSILRASCGVVLEGRVGSNLVRYFCRAKEEGTGSSKTKRSSKEEQRREESAPRSKKHPVLKGAIKLRLRPVFTKILPSCPTGCVEIFKGTEKDDKQVSTGRVLISNTKGTLSIPARGVMYIPPSLKASVLMYSEIIS